MASLYNVKEEALCIVRNVLIGPLSFWLQMLSTSDRR